MATPGDLYEVLSALLGVSQATVRAHDFSLAQAGLRTVGGRGRSAAKMTARDAASLTIVTMASDSLRDTVATFNAFAGLQTARRWSLVGRASPIETLADGHTFLDVFAAIIDGARRKLINIAEHPKDEIRSRYYFGRDGVDVRITLHKPNCHAVVRFREPASNDDAGDIESRGYTGESYDGDPRTINLARTFTIDDRTIYALGCRLNDSELKSTTQLRDEMTNSTLVKPS